MTIWPRSSPETILKLPIFAMGISFPLDGTAPLRPRCADKGQPVAGAAASARSVSEGRCGRAFLFREERRHAGGRKFGKHRCGKPAKRSALLTWARIERGRTGRFCRKGCQMPIACKCLGEHRPRPSSHGGKPAGATGMPRLPLHALTRSTLIGRHERAHSPERRSSV